MTFLVDYASARHPDPQRVRAAGYVGIARYLSNAGNPKNLTPSEASAALAVGLSIVVVWETTADRCLSGAAGGKVDGAAARTMAESCGAPATAAIYFAVDFDAQPAQMAIIAAYLDAARAACAPHPVGVYGSASVCTTMAGGGHALYAWSTVAWSHGHTFPGSHLHQLLGYVTVDGVTCDRDEVRQTDYGQWPRPVTPAPTPPPVTTIGDTVRLIDCQISLDAAGEGYVDVVNTAAHDVIGARINPADPATHGYGNPKWCGALQVGTSARLVFEGGPAGHHYDLTVIAAGP